MGLIIAPLSIVLTITAAYSANIAYVLCQSTANYSAIALLLALSLAFSALYSHLGLSRFKAKEEIWIFETPFYFATNKVAAVIFLCALLLNIFGSGLSANNALAYGSLMIMIVIMVTISFGTLIGFFRSGSFIEKHNIRRTH